MAEIRSYYKIEWISRRYSRGSATEERVRCNQSEATLVSSECPDSPNFHAPCLDIDYHAFLIPSSTSGHFHLYLDRITTWKKYRRFLKAAMKAGLIEEGYYRMSVQRKGTFLRMPHVRKNDGSLGENLPYVSRSEKNAAKLREYRDIAKRKLFDVLRTTR